MACFMVSTLTTGSISALAMFCIVSNKMGPFEVIAVRCAAVKPFQLLPCWLFPTSFFLGLNGGLVFTNLNRSAGCKSFPRYDASGEVIVNNFLLVELYLPANKQQMLPTKGIFLFQYFYVITTKNARINTVTLREEIL